MVTAIAFDVYGTLVDPLAMEEHLRARIGDAASRFAALWREKQLEYSFRRGLMRQYLSFDLCTAQALTHTMRTLAVRLSAAEQADLLARYRELAAFPDVLPGIAALAARGHTLVAFSNGVAASVRAVLEHAGILPHLHDVISVEEVQSFKPDPSVYAHLAQRLGRAANEIWLVSSNPFDVIGAKVSGLKAAWLRRNPAAIFDPWGIEPDLVMPNLDALAAWFMRQNGAIT